MTQDQPTTMAFPRGVPDGQTLRSAAPAPKGGLLHDMAEALQWGMLPAVLFIVLRSVGGAGAVGAGDALGASLLLAVTFTIALVMRRN